MTLEQFNAVAAGRLGWVCARCSRSLSPDVRECPCSPSLGLPSINIGDVAPVRFQAVTVGPEGVGDKMPVPPARMPQFCISCQLAQHSAVCGQCGLETGPLPTDQPGRLFKTSAGAPVGTTGS